MNFRLLGSYVVVAAVAITAAKWSPFSSPDPVAVASPPSGPQPHAAGASQERTPFISVSSYGTVTLRVEQQPLEWVLEEIAKQSGWSDVKERAGADKPSIAASVTPTGAVTGCTTATLEQTIAHGNDEQRYENLLRARSVGVSVEDSTLRRLYETDTSDRVRALAFQSYLQGRMGSIGEMREALEAGLAVQNHAVQSEARRRLDSLLAGEGFDTSVP